MMSATSARMLSALLAALTFMCSAPCFSQSSYRIFFVDKGQGEFTPGSAAYQTALATFHADALERRARIGMDPLLTLRDRLIHDDYLNALQAMGVTVQATSRWRNMVIADLDLATAALVRANTAVVARVERISDYAYTEFSQAPAFALLPECAPPSYGASAVTSDIIDATPLHKAGVYGQGVVVGLIDDGFRWRTLAPLQHISVRAEFDVISGDDVTSNQPNDHAKQDGHGTLVLSVLAGYAKDSLIGVAPATTVLLAKSENTGWERRIEEDHYSIAVEWLERNGANIITSSVGYRYFDSSEAGFRYEYLDGKTTTPAIAVNIATTLGVICVCAIGNNGPSDSSLISPADADSVIAVGGSLRSGQAMGFSSSGPTADGRIKPDIMALGAKVRAAGTGDKAFLEVDGTSMAAPALAGGIALLRSIYPDVAPWVLRRALYATSRFPETLDTSRGHGLPSFARAAQALGPGPVQPSVVISEGRRYVLATVFNEREVSCVLRVRSVGTTQWNELLPTRKTHPSYVFELDNGQSASVLEYQVVATDGPAERIWPHTGVGLFPMSGADIPCGATLPNIITSVHQEQTSTAVRIAPSIIGEGRSTARILGLARIPNAVHVIALVPGVITDVPWHATDGGASVMLDVSRLTPGAYAAVATGADGRADFAPFTIIR